MCKGVETVVRVIQQNVNDDNDPVYTVFINNEILRPVMKKC